MPTVEHIVNVSFKDHFLSAQEAAPKNGSIQVNSNTFDVTFVDGKVNAKFTSGNWFTNLFRSSTLTRFTQTLQTQYDDWVNNQAKAGGGDGVPGGVVHDMVVNDHVQEPPVMENLPNDPNVADENAVINEGVKDNPNVAVENKAQGMPEAKDIQNNPNVADENAGIDEGVKENPNVGGENKAQGVPAAKGLQNNPNVADENTAIDGIIDVLHANYDKIDKNGLRYSKAVMKAFAMPDTAASLSEDDAASYERAVVGESMPKNMAKLLSKLGEIGKLAALRNQLTNVPSGRECDEIVRNAGFHFNFADGERLVAKNGGSTDKSVAAANEAIVKKIESLCGKCHSNQLSSIYFTLSQSGAGSTVRDAFIQQGIRNDEHMALSFSLEKNDETGAVVVTISEPPGFPVRFHWTAAVALDGTVTTTPMEIEKKV